MSTISGRITAITTSVLAGAVSAFGQRPRIEIETIREGDSVSPVWFVLAGVLVLAIVVTFLESRRRSAAESEAADRAENLRRLKSSATGTIDADRESRWAKKTARQNQKTQKERRRAVRRERRGPAVESAPKAPEISPVFKITRPEMARPFQPLPDNTDEMLLDAIEQLHEDYIEDLEARDLALNVVRNFPSRNTVDALADVALYDLSASLRSKAVTILTEFDHESVFETLVIASADPSREVQAAAARGLFKLTIDRREAWLRLAELEDDGRLRRCAQAVASGDFAKQAIERLTRNEREHVLESVAMLTLLIVGGETDEIFDALERHLDDETGLAIVHVLGIVGEPSQIERLADFRGRALPDGSLAREIDSVLETDDVCATIR